MLASVAFLRLLGALCVLFFHTNGSFEYALEPTLPFLSAYGGYIGNAIFFITSGYLLEGRMDVYSESLHRFIGKRVLKVYPLYILSNLVIKLVFLRGQEMSLFAWVQLFTLTGAGWFGSDATLPNQHTWFVCVWLLCLLVSWFCHRTKHSKEVSIVLLLVGLSLVYIRPTFPILNYVVGEALLYFFSGTLLLKVTRTKDHRTIAALGMLLLGIALAGNSLFIRTAFRPELFAVLLVSGLLLLVFTLEPRISKVRPSIVRGINVWTMYLYFLQGPVAYLFMRIVYRAEATALTYTSASWLYMGVTLLSTLVLAATVLCIPALLKRRERANSPEIQ